MVHPWSIVQISDTHFGTEIAEVQWALTQAVNSIKPDVLIWSGDITQRARRRQFARAKAFLQQLNYQQLLCIPGNHDIPLYNLPLRLMAPYASFRRFLPIKHHVVYWAQEPLVIVAVNSCNPMHYKNGIFSPRLISKVERILLSFPQHWMKLVVAHHPVDAILAKDEENIVENAEVALAHWLAAGLDLIMGGHIHHQFERPLTVRYPLLPTSGRVLQAGTAISRRTRSGLTNSFVHLTVPRNKLESSIQFWDYSEVLNHFVAQPSLRLFRET